MKKWETVLEKTNSLVAQIPGGAPDTASSFASSSITSSSRMFVRSRRGGDTTIRLLHYTSCCEIVCDELKHLTRHFVLFMCTNPSGDKGRPNYE